MKITSRLKIYIIVMHVLMLTVTWIAEVPVWAIIILEVVIVTSVILGLWWVSALSKQYQLISSSIENIKSEDFTIQLKATGQKEFDVLVNVYNTMIQHLKAERVSTSEMNHFLASIIENSPSGIVLLDFDNKIKAVNPSAEKLLASKKNELLGKGFDEIPSDIAEILYYDSSDWQVLNQGLNRIFRVYGGKFINRGFETRFVLFDDFSKEVYQMEKQSYEKIVRIMGHEVNNTTGAVNSVLDTYIGKNEDSYASAFQIVKERNINLSHFMKRLSEVVRLPAPELLEINLIPITKQCVVLLKPNYPNKNITWRILNADIDFSINADQIQIEQALINILTNAAEAIENTGFIEIDYLVDSIALVIRNNGEPITQEQQKNIFSPFYTTKSTGKGVGLTLTREILMNHNCSFHLKTMDSGITEFYIGRLQ